MYRERILVAYASKHGATVEIAERIASVLRTHNVHALAIPADIIGNVAEYRAVILGSAVYAGQWRKEALQFLKRNEETLREKPVWLFSTGPTGEGDPLELLEGWTLPKAVESVAARIHPKDVTVFGGALFHGKLNRMERIITKAVKAPFGDFRDWPAVDAWATTIAAELVGLDAHQTAS